jgi:ribosomal subunit interface protein
VDIVVKGRNVEVPDHFRERVAEKLAPSERLDSRVIRLDVELMHEKNPRQSANCQRVEITCYSKGPIIRLRPARPDFYAALDAAATRLEARLRKAHDRRRVSHGRHTPPSVAEATAGLPRTCRRSRCRATAPPSRALRSRSRCSTRRRRRRRPGRRHRAAHRARQDHHADPMSTTDALHEMELVGHDFFLFCDKESGPAERRLPPARLRLRGASARFRVNVGGRGASGRPSRSRVVTSSRERPGTGAPRAVPGRADLGPQEV